MFGVRPHLFRPIFLGLAAPALGRSLLRGRFLRPLVRRVRLGGGSRLLADHLNGDVYFRIHRDSHNLDRARTQFKLVADMETKMDQMAEIVRKCSK